MATVSPGSGPDGLADSTATIRVYPPVYRLGKAGRWTRDALMTAILSGTPVLLQIQSFRRPLVTRFMKAVSFLGEEEFYTILLPFLMWICDFKMGYLLSIVMALGFSIGGFLKSIFCMPRPPMPPVSPADKCQDWALPSHHAILNVSVPWYLWIFVYTQFDWSTVAVAIAFVGVVFWCFSILFSRLYLGVHSPADILIGGIIGCVLLLLWLLVEDMVLTVMDSEKFVSLVIVLSFCFLTFHPDPRPHTIILTETTTMLCVANGVLLGLCINNWFGIDAKSWVESGQAFHPVWVPLRYVLGLVVLLCSKEIFLWLAKAGTMSLLSLLGLSHVYVKRVSEAKFPAIHFSPERFTVLNKPEKKVNSTLQLNINYPVKMITYTLTGATLSSGVFVIFNYFQL